MRLSGSSLAPTRVEIELDDGVKLTLEVNKDNSLTVRETTFCTLMVVPEASNCIRIVPVNPNEAPRTSVMHYLSEDHNADPCCGGCGWKATFALNEIPTREKARNQIREHIADMKERRAT